MKSIVLAFLAFLAAAGLQRRVVPASSPASVFNKFLLKKLGKKGSCSSLMTFGLLP